MINLVRYVCIDGHNSFNIFLSILLINYKCDVGNNTNEILFLRFQYHFFRSNVFQHGLYTNGLSKIK